MTQSDTVPSIRLLPDLVGGETSVSDSMAPTTIIDEPADPVVNTSSSGETDITVNITSTAGDGIN